MKEMFLLEDSVHVQILHKVLSTVNVHFSTNGMDHKWG